MRGNFRPALLLIYLASLTAGIELPLLYSYVPMADLAHPVGHFILAMVCAGIAAILTPVWVHYCLFDRGQNEEPL